jgi:ABC-type transport system involved in cytochrome c biogenesis permease subunit
MPVFNIHKNVIFLVVCVGFLFPVAEPVQNMQRYRVDYCILLLASVIIKAGMAMQKYSLIVFGYRNSPEFLLISMLKCDEKHT